MESSVSPADDDRVAVYIDFDNIVISRRNQAQAHQGMDPSIDLDAIIDFCSSFGTVATSRAYGDWSREETWPYRQRLLSRAVDTIQMFTTSGKVKNAADIRLAIDVIEDLYLLHDITDVVIVAGDSDYIPLAQRVRRLGRRVIGIGVAGSISHLLAAACDEFYDYDGLPGLHTDGDEDEETPATGGSDRSGKTDRSGKNSVSGKPDRSGTSDDEDRPGRTGRSGRGSGRNGHGRTDRTTDTTTQPVAAADGTAEDGDILDLDAATEGSPTGIGSIVFLDRHGEPVNPPQTAPAAGHGRDGGPGADATNSHGSVRNGSKISRASGSTDETAAIAASASAAKDVTPNVTPDDNGGTVLVSKSRATQLLLRALTYFTSKTEEEWHNASKVKNQILRMEPAFQESALGYSTFTKFVESRQGQVEIRRNGNITELRLRAGRR